VESLGCELEREVFGEVLFEMGFGGKRWRRWEQFRRLGVESPAPLDVASPLVFKAWASLSLLFLSILESAPKKQTEQGLDTS